MRLNVPALVSLLLLLAATLCGGQQVSLLGLRSLNHAGAFHSLKQDAAGNLYTLFDAHDGVRILKLSADGTQVLAQTQLGQAGDAGIALALDSAGSIYVAGTSTSLGSIAGTSGTAFPNRSDSTTNSFVARFSPALTLQWLSFVGSGKTAVTAIDATASTVYVTGGIYANTLPVTSGGIQQTPAPNSSGNGFVEAFNGGDGTLQYATYLTGANGDTQPAAIVADSTGAVYVAGTTTATGYPTTSALVPVMRYTGASPVSGFVTKLTPMGDGFVFSTFIPGGGLTSIALDTSTSSTLLLSGNLSPGLFPLTNVQQPIAAGVSYQSALRLALDGSSVLSSTLLVPSLTSSVSVGSSGQSLIFASPVVLPLLPLQPLESLGTAAMLRVDASGNVDRISRIGGIPVNNSAYASIPVTADSVLRQTDGSIVVGASVAPALSSELLASEHYDFPLAAAPSTALPSTVHDALPLATCSGSACSGSAGLLARLAPDATVPQLALSTDDHPNLVLRNLGPVAATGLQIAATNYTVASDCGTMLAAGAECYIALTGTSAGSITVQAANAAALTVSLPATTRVANAITVTPHELDFGIVTSTSSANTQTLTIRNLGNTIQTFTSTRINSISAAYGLTESTSTCATTTDGTQKMLAANSTCTITLALTPSSTGSNDGAVNAMWQVGAYDIPVTGYTQAAATSLSATTIDFGRQYRNGLRTSRYLYVSNAGDQPQAHSSVVSTNAVFTITDECPATLQPHSVCRIATDYRSTTAPSSDALSLVVDGINVTVLGETLPQPSIGGATVNPNLTLSATSVVFSDPVMVTTASAVVQTVTIGNIGAVPFALQIVLTGDFAQSTDCPASLLGGASCSVNIVFTPSATGLRQGLLAVTAGSTSPVYVALSGTSSAILPSSNGVAFGDIPLNTPSVQWLKIQQGLVSATASSSDAAYQVILVEDMGYGHGQPPASSFSTTATGSCLNCWLGIQFQPVTTGMDSAAVSLSSSSAGKPTSVVVSGNGVPLSGLILTPLMEDFGPVAVHSSSASTHFQLTNATSAAITTSGVSATGNFSVTAEIIGGTNCTSAMLAPGASCFVSVQFIPTATGTRTGQLTVQTSAGVASATLAGTGSADPGISFIPGELRFDNTPTTLATQQTLTLTNTSAAVEVIGTPMLSDSHFSTNSACSTLAPSASCTITVMYSPTAALSNGTLSIPVTTSPAGAPFTTTYTVELTGQYTSESAGIQIIPGEHTTVNFGAAPTDVLSSSRILHVNNLSGKTLAVDVAAPRNFSVAANTCTTLTPSGSCDLSVQFVPQTAGSITGTIFVQGAPTDGSAIQSGLGYLEGYGQGSGNLSITGNLSLLGVLPFGQVTSGQSASRTLTLTNPISATTSVTVRRIQSAAPFLTTTTCGQPLAPGQSCTISVTYAPIYQINGSTTLVAARVDTSSIVIESNASIAPQFVNLSGQVAPVSSANAVDGEPLQTYSLSKGSLTFTNTAVGSSSPMQSVILTNTGTATVHIQKLIASAGFAISGNCGTLLAGTTCNISIAYQPQTAGDTMGTLEIQSDAAASLEFITLAGTGSAASVSLSPQSLDFGRVLVGSTGSQFVTLTNTGEVGVTLNGVVVASTDFSLTSSSTSSSPCPAAGGMLNAGASCTIAIVFKPSTATTIRGALSVATSATALPLTVALSGVGTQPLLVVAPASLSLGNVVLGSSSSLSLTLRNVGTDAVDGLAFSTTRDFNVTSTCGITTLNAGSSCSVSVTYRPTTTGNATGTLTIRSTDPASPLLVPLTGIGITSTAGVGGGILLTVNGASSATATVAQGISATYALRVTPTNGYLGTVALTCAPDSAVAYATCSVLPSTVSLNNGAQDSTVTITTVMEVNTSRLQPMTTRKAVLAFLIPGSVVLFWLRRRRYAVLPLFLLAFCIIGCGGGPDPHLRYVAQGTYGFHVTASSTNGTITSQSVSLTLVVGPKGTT